MNTERFTQILENPDQLAEVSYQEIKRAVMDFPYCHNLRLLLMHKSQMEQNAELNQNIQSAAAYSNNRSHFYRSFKARGGIKEKLNPVQLAEEFLEENKNKINTEVETQPAIIPAESITPKETTQSLAFDLSDPNIEDITHEINISNSRRMEDDDSMEFDLNEHLKKFREEKLEPEIIREESPFKDQGNKALFLEDLIEAKKEESNKIEEEKPEPEIVKEEVLEKMEEPISEAPPTENIETLSAEEIAEIPPQSIPIPIDELINDPLEEIKEDIPSNHEEAEILLEEEELNEEEEDIEEIPIPDLVDFQPEPATHDLPVVQDSPDDIELTPTSFITEKETIVKKTVKEVPLEITNLKEEVQPKANKAPQEEIKKKPRVPKPSPKTSFSSWLKQFESPETPVSLDSSNQAPNPDKKADRHEQQLKSESRKTGTPNTAKKVRLEDLIEAKKKKAGKKKKVLKAIDDPKKIKKAKKGKKKPKKHKKQGKIIDFAAQSLNEDEEIASETLAQILARQGAYDKAIRIYERLKLIYPEKSVFFASEIEKLNKLK